MFISIKLCINCYSLHMIFVRLNTLVNDIAPFSNYLLKYCYLTNATVYRNVSHRLDYQSIIKFAGQQVCI